MNRLSNYFRSLMLLAAILLGTLSVHAQGCATITLTGLAKICRGDATNWSFANISGKTIKPASQNGVVWDFGDGHRSSQDTVTHSYDTVGVFTVTLTLTFTDGTTCTVKYQNQIRVNGPPKAIMDLTTCGVPLIQCFTDGFGHKNKFCFDASKSQIGKSGAPIKDYIWNFGDADTAHGKYIYHSYDSSGKYKVSLTVIDTNGCSNIVFANTDITVLKDIKTHFTVLGKTGCNKTTYTFNNVSDTAGAFITNWVWNFGDGSPLDNTTWSPTHTYTASDTFTVTLTLYNKLHCLSVDTAYVVNMKPRIHIQFKDTICYHGNNVTFKMESIPDAYASWDFGDPPSGPQNSAYSNGPVWDQQHKFTGPKAYLVKVKVFIASCPSLNLDTCMTVHITGPAAVITMPPLPPPLSNANNYVPVKPMPRSEFIIQQRNVTNNVLCEIHDVPYAYFIKVGSAYTHYQNVYCNSNGTKINDTNFLCNGQIETGAGAYAIYPTGAINLGTYKDSVQIVDTFHPKTDVLPALGKQYYYPSTGQRLPMTLHDSDLFSCSTPEHMVHFPNYSVKYRMYVALDDNPMNYLEDTFMYTEKDSIDSNHVVPGRKVMLRLPKDWSPLVGPGNGWKDACRNKTYPWASDSLQYMWQFTDNVGIKCTSTVNGIDWGSTTPKPNVVPEQCLYSTLPNPYHDYRDPLPPYSGCSSVTLGVWDPVTHCGDTATMQLKLGPPKASYDQSAFCNMNWDIQTFMVTAKGQPDPQSTHKMRGFKLDGGVACTGPVMKYDIDLSEIIPNCGPQNYWIQFDSAAGTTVGCVDPYTHYKYIDYGFLGSTNKDGYQVGAPKKVWEDPTSWNKQYWYEIGDEGCKTVGVVIQNGTCTDTFWYHDYICFNKLDAQFTITEVDTSGKQPPVVIGGSYFKETNARTMIPYPVRSGIPPTETTPGMLHDGTDIMLTVRSPNMTRLTSFQYALVRQAWPGNEPYFSLPTYPDTTELNPFTTSTERDDSITSMIDTFLTLQDSSVYTPLYNLSGVPYDTALPSKLYFRPGEIAGLEQNGQITIPINDFRGRQFTVNCGRSTVTFYKVNKNKPLCIKSMNTIKNPSDPLKDNTKLRSDGVPIHDTIRFHLPYPGAYEIGSRATNLDGCVDLGYHKLIYGHLARFNVVHGDSIICLGDTIRLNNYIRYWTTQCPPLPGTGEIPPFCINGVIGGWGGDFTPWDSNGISQAQWIAYRHKFHTTFDIIGTGQAERVYVDWGDKSGWQRWDKRTTVHIAHKYAKPGVYTVTMASNDTAGVWVYTTRKNLIKVIQVAPGYAVTPPQDTLKFCAPQSVTFQDTTHFKGSPVDVRRKFGYLVDRVDSGKVLVPQQTYHVVRVQKSLGCGSLLRKDSTVPAHYVWQRKLVKDTLFVDSIQYVTWYPGDGRHITIVEKDTAIIDYQKNGKYTVRLDVFDANKDSLGQLKPCSGTITKQNYINIRGPIPNFKINGDTAGCWPFTVKLKNISDTSKTYEWDWGDSNISSTVAYQDDIFHTYNKPGTYQITVRQTEDVFNPYTGQTVPCTIHWPTDKDSIHFTVIVYPHSPVDLGPDKFACKGDPVKFTATSRTGDYKFYKWDFGDGSAVQSTTDDSTITHTYYVSGKYKVSVQASTIHGCAESDTLLLGVDSVKADYTIDSSMGMIAKFGFLNHSTNAVKYHWDFGDGQTKDATDTLAFVHVYTGMESADQEAPFSGKTPSSDSTRYDKSYNVILRAYSPHGCIDSIQKTVHIHRIWQHYNIFTPNGDGHNDVFDPKVVGETTYDLQIYNRWGEKVFQSNDDNNDWNGRVNNTGAECPSGTYFYVWKFKIVGGPDKTVNGTVDLVR